MKILITGAFGQLGHALQHALADEDLISLGHNHLDITNVAAVREAVAAYRSAIVINAAAYNDVDGAETSPRTAYRVNTVGARNLALATAASEIPILHLSTDYVFDGTARTPYHEFVRPNPLSVYGASKLAGEEAVIELNRRHYVVRTAWLYHTIGRNVPLMLMQAFGTQPEVRVIEDRRGSPTYVPHLAEALRKLITTEAYGVYHLTNRGGATWYEVALLMARTLHIETPITPVSHTEFPRPAARPRYSELTSWQDPVIDLPSWEEGVLAFAANLDR